MRRASTGTGICCSLRWASCPPTAADHLGGVPARPTDVEELVDGYGVACPELVVRDLMGGLSTMRPALERPHQLLR